MEVSGSKLLQFYVASTKQYKYPLQIQGTRHPATRSLYHVYMKSLENKEEL